MGQDKKYNFANRVKNERKTGTGYPKSGRNPEKFWEDVGDHKRTLWFGACVWFF